jgi:hypothetical protein
VSSCWKLNDNELTLVKVTWRRQHWIAPVINLIVILEDHNATLRFVFLLCSALGTMLREFPSVSVKNAGTLSGLGYAYTSLTSATKLPLSGLTSCFFPQCRDVKQVPVSRGQTNFVRFCPTFLKERKCAYDITKPPQKFLQCLCVCEGWGATDLPSVFLFYVRSQN